MSAEQLWRLEQGDGVAGMATLAPGEVHVAITDPVWPNRPAELWPDVDADALFRAACEQLERLELRRLIVIVGQDTDPRFLAPVPRSLRFVRTCWLRYVVPSYNGTVLNGGVVAYVFGDHRGPDGMTLLPGEITATRGDFSGGHPCPRKVEHLAWLVRFFTSRGETILDPFAGSGTTGIAAVEQGRRFVGWERDADYALQARAALGRTREQLEIPPRPQKKAQAKFPFPKAPSFSAANFNRKRRTHP